MTLKVVLISNVNFIQVLQPICWQGSASISCPSQWDTAWASPKYCHNSGRRKYLCSFHLLRILDAFAHLCASHFLRVKKEVGIYCELEPCACFQIAS